MRLKVRHLMLVVIVAALGVTGWRTIQERSRHFERRATLHDFKARFARIHSKAVWKTPEQQAAAREEMEAEVRIRDAYRRAATCPWLRGPNGE